MKKTLIGFLMLTPVFVLGIAMLGEVLHNFTAHFGLAFLSSIYFMAALVSSCCYGRYAFDIHNIPDDPAKKKPLHMVNQFWFNGLGAFIGWCLLYYLIIIRFGVFTVPISQIFKNLSGEGMLAWQDIVILLLAFMGITGNLPQFVLLGKMFR